VKYLEYKVVEEVNLERLAQAVNQLLREGWEPHGPLIVVPRHDNEIADGLYQPVVRVQR
jgi:hypothetical protein